MTTRSLFTAVAVDLLLAVLCSLAYVAVELPRWSLVLIFALMFVGGGGLGYALGLLPPSAKDGDTPG